MKINFSDRLISAGPLTVLQHLYYYTVQYGLSVKQYTGKHQDFWAAELPSLLKKAQNSPMSLKRLITQLERLGSQAEGRLLKRRQQLKGGKWAEKEIVLNAQLLAVLAALPDSMLARMFMNLTGIASFPKACRVVDLKLKKEHKGEDTDFVEPDLLLLGEDYLLMVEMKTCGGPTSSRKYPPRQLLNYMRLIVECRNAQDKTLPKKFAHLIIAPSSGIQWLEHHDKWIYDINEKDFRKVSVNVKDCLRFGRRYVKKHAEQFRSVLESTPIYYRSWEQLACAYSSVVRDEKVDGHYSHWNRVGAELKELAKRAGKYIN